jgi:TonB family protein
MAPVNADTTTKTTNTSKTTTTVKKKRGKVTSSVEPVNKNLKVQVDKSGVYETTEVRPSFPGGQSAIDDYINSNFEYPDNAVDNNTQGNVLVQFTVNENGKVSNAKVIGRKAGDGLDEEAERVISRMPKWTPGTVKGKPVKTNVVIPLTFRIEE